MRSRLLILGLIILTLLATCLAAAAKLRATPKHDRIQVGMTRKEVESVLGPCNWSNVRLTNSIDTLPFEIDEGLILVACAEGGPVVEKKITRRGPFERLAWLAGWR